MESFQTSIIEVHNVGFLNKEEIRKLVKEFGEIVAIDHNTTNKANYTIKFLSEIDFDNLNKHIEQKVLSIIENPGVKYEDPSSRVIMKIINHRYKEKDNDLNHKFKYPFTSNANIYIDFIVKITTNKKKTNNGSKNNCFNFELTGRRARTLKREKHMRFTNEGTYNSFIVNYKNFIRHRKRLGRKKKYSKNMQESDMINSLLGQANILFLNNNLNEAINKLKEIIKLNSEIPEAYHLLNLIYSQNGNFDKSLEMLMLYAQTKKNDKELWIKCASLYEKSNNYSKAIYCFTRLQRLQKDNHLILIKKAMLCEEDKHLKRAALNYLRLYYINKDLIFESNKRIRVKPTVNRHLKKTISKDTNSNNSDSFNELNNDVLSHYDGLLQQTYEVFSTNISRENIMLMIKKEQSNNIILSNLLNDSGFKVSFQFLSEKYLNNNKSFNLFLYVILLLLKDKKKLHIFLISLKVVLVSNESVMTLIENNHLDNTESFKDLTFFLFHKFSSIPINSNSFLLFYLLFLIALNIEVEDQKLLFSNIRLQLSDKDQTMKDIVLLFYLLIDLNDTYTRYFDNNTIELKEKYTIIMNDCVSFFKNLLGNLKLNEENTFYFTFLISIYISTIKYHHIFFVYNKKTLIDNFQNPSYSNSFTTIMDNLIYSNFNKNFGKDIDNSSNNQLKLIESSDKKSTEFNCDSTYINYLDKPIYLNRKVLNIQNPNDKQTPNTNLLKRKRKLKILSKPSFKFKLSSKKPKLLLLKKNQSNITFNDNDAILKQNDNRNKYFIEIKRKIEKTLSLINSSIDQYSKLDFIKEIKCSQEKLNLLNNIITIEIQLLDIKDEILDLYLSDPQSQKYRFIINGNYCEIVDINEVSVDDMLEFEINNDNNTIETMIFNRKSTHLKQNLNDIKFMGIVKLVEKQFRSINNIVKFISLSKFLELIIETVENSTFIIKDKDLIINEDVNELKMIQNLSFSVMSFYNKTNESEFFKLIVISIITSLNLNTHQKSFKLIKKFMHIFKCNNNSNLFCVFWDNILKLRNYTKYKPMIYKLSKTTTYENNCLMKFILSNLYLVSGSHSISNKLISDLIKDYKSQNPIFFFSLSINYLFLSLSRNNLQKERSLKLALILFNKYYDSRITSNFTESNYNKGRFYQFLCLDSKAINCYTNVINKYGDFETVEDKNKDIFLKSIYNTSLIYKKQGNNWKAHDLIMNNIII